MIYSITSSARASSCAGTSMPSALAVLRLIAKLYFVGNCTGTIDAVAEAQAATQAPTGSPSAPGSSIAGDPLGKIPACLKLRARPGANARGSHDHRRWHQTLFMPSSYLLSFKP
jgi:hypothetical protein